MYKLKDFLIKFLEIQDIKIISNEIYCLHTNTNIVSKAELLRDTLGFYSFNLIRKGSCNLHYNGHFFKLQERSVYVSAPGFPISLTNISNDYDGISLLVDEKVLFESPVARKILQSVFIPLIHLTDPIIPLNEKYFEQVRNDLLKILDYLENPISFTKEALHLSFGLFLLDLFDYIETHKILKHSSINTERIFVDFINLLTKNYIDQHHIGFYAKKLNITTTYLSRIVKNLSHRTVKEYINRMLLMEAIWLLKTTNLSVSEIADRLNFANQSSFCKFLKRMKGISPKDYR